MKNHPTTLHRWADPLAVLVFLASACSGAGKGDDAAPPVKVSQAVAPEPEQQAVSSRLSDYRRAVAANANDAVANRQLGVALMENADLTQAYHFLLRANALKPSDVANSLALGTFYLIDAKADLAREKARGVLDGDPGNIAGAVLLAATASNDEIPGSIKRLESARPKFGSDALPRLALGSLYLRAGDTASAERALQDAATAEPKSAGVHSLLGVLYGARGNSAAAARELTAFKDLVAGDSVGRVKVATLYLQLNRREDAKRVLREVVEQSSVQSPSSRLLAALALADGNQDEAGKALASLPAETSDVDELLLRGRYHLLRREISPALADIRRALGGSPKLAPIHYQMALVDLGRANTSPSKATIDTVLKDAVGHLEMASKLAPGYPEAVFQLAAVRTQLGASDDAIGDLDRYARANPNSVTAKLLLGASLLGSSRVGEATEALQDVLRIEPKSAEAHYWLGMILLRASKVADARREFETAASNASPSYTEPMTQLVVLDLADRHADAAYSRLTRQIDRTPQSARLYDLLGLVNGARNDQSAAEAAYVRAVRLDPNLIGPHVRLADIYRASGKLDQSVLHADEAVRLGPKSVAALMAAGASHQEKGETAVAHQAYVRVLQLDPRNLGAANNLAVLLSEQPGGLDSAVMLARLASQLAPNDPHVSDTLGWIMYKRGAYDEAAPFLRFSAAKLPESPSVQYHLGMTAHQLGDTAVARQALMKAVTSGSNFVGKEDARKTLAQLK